MRAMISRIHYSYLANKLSTIGLKLSSSQTKCPPNAFSIRPIYSKAMRDPSYTRPPPFPYKEKNFTIFHRFFDRTTDRLDENSKIIVVDGAVAAGKSAFAKQLADDLDMLYIPEANMDMKYINSYGFDLRTLDSQVPESVRTIDTKGFCLNPKQQNVAYLQVMLYQLKVSLYIDALAHLLSTGQGVVLDKSPYSDFVYIEALVKEGFITKTARAVYYDVVRHTIDELLRPHLTIYLDMPVNKVLEKIKERGYPHEQNSKALTPSFLTTLEETYKSRYLKDISIHSELLMYDWSDGGDVEVVIEDIERLDFDKYTVYDEKMKDWNFRRLMEWNDIRKRYADEKDLIMTCFNVPRYDCPELLVSGEDFEKLNDVYRQAPGHEYAEGYNVSMGDSSVWWKLGSKDKYSL